MEHGDQQKKGSGLSRFVTMLKGLGGWATGDRDVEGEARAELETGAKPAPDEAAREATTEVRREHGDLQDRGAADVQP